MRLSYIPLAVSSAVFAIAAVAQTTAVKAPAQPTSLAAGAPATASGTTGEEDKALFEASCAACHDLTQAAGQSTNEAGWKDTISRMIGYGAAVTPEQADRLARYLAAVHSSASTATPGTSTAPAGAPPLTTAPGQPTQVAPKK